MSSRRMLERLGGIRVLQRRGGAGGETYRFSHALIQDAALGMLPRERYRSLHARVADIIEARFPASAAARPQVIAHHRTEAMQPEQAVAWWQRGAQQAMQRGAMEEALVQLRRGIALLQALPESPAHAQAELDMQLLAGNALLSLRGHSALETGQAYDRARHSWPRRCRASRNCATPCTASGAMPGCAAISAWPWSGRRRCWQQAGRAKSHGGLAIAWSAMGHSQFILGRFPEALESLERGLDYDARTERDRRYGLALQATVISTRCYSAWARTFMGRLAETRRDLMATLEAAEAAAFPFATANAHYALGRYDYDTGAEEDCIDRLRITVALCEEHDIEYLAMAAKAIIGLLLGRRGDHRGRPDAGARRRWPGTARRRRWPSCRTTSAWRRSCMARAGDCDGALQRHGGGLRADGRERPNGRSPCCCASAARSSTCAGRTEAAEADLRAAVATATAQQAGLFRLHAAIALAALLSDRARRRGARATLDAALAPFAAEAEPVVLRARAALAALQPLP